MNVKSLKTQFIGAIAMVLVAAIAMGSSTYAWFTTNTSVRAENMSVQAKSAGGLYITDATANPGWNSIINSKVDLVTAKPVELNPSSSYNMTDWFKATAATPDNYGKNNDGYTLVSSENATELGTYRLAKKVWIRTESDLAALQLDEVTINATANNPNISDVSAKTALGKSLTVAFKVVSFTYPEAVAVNGVYPSQAIANPQVVFVSNEAPTDGTNNAVVRHGAVKSVTENEVTTYVVDNTVTWNQNTGIGTGSGQSKLNIWEKPAALAERDFSNVVFEVEMYVYFDGESESCTTNNLTNAIELTGDIDVSFTSLLPTTTSNP